MLASTLTAFRLAGFGFGERFTLSPTLGGGSFNRVPTYHHHANDQHNGKQHLAQNNHYR